MNLQNMQKRKKSGGGFTLVELAIVLVVIGLLMGMAFKGKSLVDAARIKAEANKIQKLSTAINTYVAKYDALPGQLDNGTVQNNQVMFRTMIQEGLLKESDFKSIGSGNQGGLAWWNFVGCSEASGLNGGSVWQVTPASNQTNLCVYRSSMKTEDNVNQGTGGDPDREWDGVTICQMETLLDDKNIFGGDGRSTTNALQGDDAGKFTPNWDCANTDLHGGTKLGYAFRIY